MLAVHQRKEERLAGELRVLTAMIEPKKTSNVLGESRGTSSIDSELGRLQAVVPMLVGVDPRIPTNMRREALQVHPAVQPATVHQLTTVLLVTV